jgi:hypothetical protein
MLFSYPFCFIPQIIVEESNLEYLPVMIPLQVLVLLQTWCLFSLFLPIVNLTLLCAVHQVDTHFPLTTILS